ncbi:MAG: HAD family hydrolase [Corynebacterium sp.]|uniref:HAD family hydrolase n=1 Tax=Corynebacterium sp. TaxID=1720 RepID=UPI0026E089AF|nr:HAD family hydrolase [Corynebacterium sp.]MDO5670189.1 HAD family hydrolase [Corynebacterium sp.]
MTKLIVCDLDGTLIGRDEILSESALKVATVARDKGVAFTIATGRTNELASTFAEHLDISVPYIVSNGAKVIENGRVLWQRMIPLRGLRELLGVADHMGLSIIYTIDSTEYVHRETTWILRQREQFDRYHKVRPIDGSDWHILYVEKVTVMDDIRDGRIDRIEDWCSQLGDGYGYTKYTDKAVELVHEEATKANALQWILRYLNISTAEVVAFGDHQNDIDMLTLAGTGVAVSNAIDDAKLAADVVTEAPEAEGVLAFVREILKD